MSEAIKRMLAERERAGQTHDAARRKAVLDPHQRAYRFGFDLVRRYEGGTRTGAIADALAEGMIMGLMDGMLESAEQGWLHSETRRAVLAALDETAPGA